MKNLVFIFILLFVMSCDAIESLEQEKSSNSRTITYKLYQASKLPIWGEIIFTELESTKTKVEIKLKTTNNNVSLPAHLHFGDINQENGELAIRLNNVDGMIGYSETILENVVLNNGNTFTFDSIKTINGSIKIHMSDKLFNKVVLAYGNIGINNNQIFNGIPICTGH